MLARHKPANTIARRRRFGKGTAGKDTPAAGVHVGWPRTMSVEQQFTVNIVIDQTNVVLFDYLHKFFAPVLAHADAQRVVERCREHAGLDRMCVQRFSQRVRHDAVLGTGFNFDRQHAKTVDQLEQAMISGRFHSDNVALLRDRLQCNEQRFLTAVGNTNILRLDFAADRIEIAISDLPSQALFTYCWRIGNAAVCGARHDSLHSTMQALGRRPRHARIGNAKRNHVWLVKAVVHAFHQAAPNDGRRFH